MAIFREFDGKGRDRSGEDKRRHRQLIDDAIRKNIGDIIAEESIIGQSKKKKVKIPIKGIKEYQFIYGKNKEGTGSGTGNEKRGDKVGSASDGKSENPQQAGNEEGEDIYETEITLEELIDYLFDDLNLPYMDRKKFRDVESEKLCKKSGYKRKGIPPRLAKKRSAIERIKRKKSYDMYHKHLDTYDENERFPFKEDDLRYFRMKKDVKRESNAVVFCIMDTSGSMGVEKKYLARSFYFLLYQFIKLKYMHVEIVFVAHTTVGKEVNENDFFHKGESGGTYISSGYQKALDIIEERYNKEVWNIYAFHCSDGDNWSEDNVRAVEAGKKLCEVSNLFGYGEIKPGAHVMSSLIGSTFKKELNFPNFSAVLIAKRDDIIPGLRTLLEKEEME